MIKIIVQGLSRDKQKYLQDRFKQIPNILHSVEDNKAAEYTVLKQHYSTVDSKIWQEWFWRSLLVQVSCIIFQNCSFYMVDLWVEPDFFTSAQNNFLWTYYFFVFLDLGFTFSRESEMQIHISNPQIYT